MVRDDSYPNWKSYPEQKYFVWNKYKREMIFLEKLIYTQSNKIDLRSKNEYLKSAIQGYNFTSMKHIYEKDKKYYKYSFEGNGFYEIKLDSI